jgi:hypothetical protein
MDYNNHELLHEFLVYDISRRINMKMGLKLKK